MCILGIGCKKNTSTTANTSTTNNLVAGDAGHGGASVAGEGNQVAVSVTNTTVDGGAWDFARDANREAMKTANAAIDAANQSAAAAAAASARAMEQNAAIAGQSIKEGSALSLATQENMFRLSKESLMFGGDVLQSALSQGFDFAAQNAAITDSATRNALSFADSFSRSDQAQAMNTLIKWALGAAVLIAGAYAFRGAR